MAKTVDQVIERIEKLASGQYVPCGISTGFSELDELIGGLRPGSLFVAASLPSGGRSSFVRYVIESVGLDQSLPVLAFSPGLDALRWVERLIYAACHIPSVQMSQPHNLTKGDLLRMKDAISQTAKSSIYVDDHSLRIEEICEKVRELHQKSRQALVVVEDLPLLVNEAGLPGFHHPDDVAKVLCLLRGVAKELNIPVLVTCNQEVPALGRRLEDEKVGDYTGFTNGELISTYADQLAFLTRYHLRRFGAGNSFVDFHLVKNRGGRLGMVRMSLIEDLFLFGDDVPQEEPMSDEPAEVSEKNEGEKDGAGYSSEQPPTPEEVS